MERNTNAVISTNKLCKSYMNGEVPQHVIKNMDIQIFYKDFTVFMGPSGSGKSTLLHILSGMDSASMGEVYFKDTNFSKYSERQLAQFRKKNCGFVFQQVCLIGSMSLMDNVLVSGLLANRNKKQVVEKGRKLFAEVGLAEKEWGKYPSQISGGQMGRAGIVRALINNPEVVFADEPINNGEDDLKRKVGVWALAFLAIFLLKDILAVFYLWKHIFDPVKRMNDLAGQIARGNLDIPVDCSASFGAFSESFDIMREELLYARKGEQEADKRRREVIASISHDIKNPVASIQAIAEYQSLTTGSDELRREFETITQKTNQINGMIHNLHTSMLDELERLEVRPKELGSSAIGEALRQADFRKRIKDFEIPECLVMADQVRFMQVADNIISNSYKYADTQIEVCSWFEDECLCISIKDFGKGVKKDEEIFLTQKYFRGQNAKEKEGSGMGMYIAEYLVKGMGGWLLCRSEENAWFEVRIWLALAS